MPVPAGRVMGPLPQPRPGSPEIRPVSHVPPAGGRGGAGPKTARTAPVRAARGAGVGWTITMPSPLSCPASSAPAGKTILPRPSSRWLVYILRCSDGSPYTGITNDLPRRLKAHAAGRASKYTRSRLPVRLAYQEAQKSKSAALKREAAIKRLRRADKDVLAARRGNAGR